MCRVIFARSTMASRLVQVTCGYVSGHLCARARCESATCQVISCMQYGDLCDESDELRSESDDLCEESDDVAVGVNSAQHAINSSLHAINSVPRDGKASATGSTVGSSLVHLSASRLPSRGVGRYDDLGVRVR